MLKLRIVLVPALLLFAQYAWAQEPATRAPVTSWLKMQNEQGLITTMPAPSRAELKARLAELRSRLNQQKLELVVDEEAARFDAKDAVITLVMPGGLLYAAYRQQRHHQAAKELEQVAERLSGLRSDLVAFQVIADDSLVALALP